MIEAHRTIGIALFRAGDSGIAGDLPIFNLQFSIFNLQWLLQEENVAV
jgi:hypothetical protein